MSIYEFKSVSFTAPNRRNGEFDVKIIENATFTLDEGDFTLIIGPSGSGKSTLLRLFNRLADPSNGEITFRGENIRGYPVMDLRRRIGWMPQLPVRYSGTVTDNLKTPFHVSKTKKYTDNEINKSLEDVRNLGLLDEKLYSREAEELSVGEAQRMSLLRALILKPDVLLMDEPTSALDRRNAGVLLDQVKKVKAERNLTVVLVSHRPDEVCHEGNVVLKISDGIVRTSPCCQDGEHRHD